MSSLSIVITAFNEEEKIVDALESVKDLADEVIVVDGGSTDKTVDLVKKYTKKVYKHENNPLEIDLQKNFGFSKATSDWVLSIDADERVTPELAEEIRLKIQDSRFKNNDDVAGYWIPRKNIIFGKWIEHTGWYPDYQLRLFRNGKGKYIKKHVHEDLVIEGNIEKLSSPLIHMNYQTVLQFFERAILRYAPNEANYIYEQGYIFSYADAIKFPSKEFLSRFFAREGYKDGFHGLMLSLMMGAYHLAIFAYLWEKNKFSDKGYSLEGVTKESKRVGKELRYWFLSEEIGHTSDAFKRGILKIKRKTTSLL